MRLFAISLLALLYTALGADAQTFLQTIQQKSPGKASVTVTQSKDIDELVNFADVSGRKQVVKHPVSAPATASATDRNAADKRHAATAPADDTTRRNQQTPPAKKDTDIQHPADTQHHAEARQPKDEADGMDIPTVDMRKKMPRRSYKVDGYRVQVYAGGNSRQAKEQAQKAGNAIKMAMPDQPVYVHFYSPRWICRVGNYRSYEEANKVLKQVKALGYTQACIISGKITVTY